MVKKKPENSLIKPPQKDTVMNKARIPDCKLYNLTRYPATESKCRKLVSSTTHTYMMGTENIGVPVSLQSSYNPLQ